MRDGWTETTLGDVAEVIMGRQLSPSKKLGTRPRSYLRAANIGNWGISLNDVMQMDFTEDEEKHFASRTGDVLMVEGGNEKSVGCPALVTEREQGLCIQNTVIRCRVKDATQLSSEFLYHSLRHNFWVGKFGELCAGTTIMHLGQKRAVVFPLVVPPLVEQKRIVDVVSSVDAYIDALQQQADTTGIARNAMLHELLSAGGDDWTESTLGDISIFVSRRELPKGLTLDTPYVGLEHVEPKTTLISTWGNVKSVSSSVTPFEPEDTLFGRLRPYLHKVAFADFPGVCSPEILVLRSSSKCMPKFLYLLCSLDSTVKKCVDMSAGTRMPRTSTTDLASIEIQLPPLDEQKRIVEIVSSMDDVIQSTERAVTDAKNLRSSLLSDLLSGEHEIPASYDSLLGAA